VCKHAFELLFAFDELIACGVGHRENLTLQQVQVNLEMESHEEKLALMIRQSKEREAQQEAERRRKQIARDNRSKGMGGGAGVSGGIASMRDFADDLRSGAASAAATIETNSSFDSFSRPPTSAPPPKAGAGMKLGKGLKGGGAAPSSLLQAMAAEADESSAAVTSSRPATTTTAQGGSPGGATASGLVLTAEEKLTVTMSRESGMQGLEINGILQLLNNDPTSGKAVVPLQMGANPGFQFKTHPNIDKQLFANESSLGLRDPTRPFPVGSAVGVLKWRLASSDEALLPLLINAWPTQTGADSWEVSVEYELASATYPQLEVHNLSVTIPTPVDAPPSINASVGAATYSRRDNTVTWNVPLIDGTSASGTVELQLSGIASADALFPIAVDFSAASTLCSLSIPEVRSLDGGGPMAFTTASTLLVESYLIP